MIDSNNTQSEDFAHVRMQLGLKIPLRDTVHLSATLYLLNNMTEPAPAIFTLTPYIGQTYHERGLYFATHGYPFDPHDVSHAALESTVDPENRAEQRMVHALVGRQLVYHSAPLTENTEISGFFGLSVWLAIDQPDTDFYASVYEICVDGSSILLATDLMRARYRESLREERLIRTAEPLRYDFRSFMFTARLIAKGHRLRLVVGPLNSIYWQKNYNSGGVVAEESITDARKVTVKLFHDQTYPSALHVPLGRDPVADA